MLKIRSFLAIDLPAEIVEGIREIQDHLKQSGPYVKWVRPENIHLTLKFFGDIDEKAIDEISTVLDGVVSKTNAFDLEVRDVGVFPNTSRPRVVWVGTESRDRTINILQKEIDATLKTMGFEPEDRAFRPHLTMGRVKSLKDKRLLIAQMEKFKGFDMGSFRVEHLFLIKSDLRPTGAVYTKLRSFDLAKSRNDI